MRVPQALPADLVRGLVEHFSAIADRENSLSPNLSHTEMLKPQDSPLLVAAAQAVTPRLADFGALLFGEPLGWSIKEMGVNLLDVGGRQAMHNHANSFISGVVYLTPTHADARTVFMKSPGASSSRSSTTTPASRPARTTPTNGSARSPQPEPEDLVLFASYLMHAVPPNPGPRRITMAVNAIPTHIDSWGYKIMFSG